MNHPPEHLPFLLIQLDENVHRLTNPHEEIIYLDVDDETPVPAILVLPPLLEQLSDAIGSTNNSNARGAGLANTRAVLDFSALALLGQIEEDMRLIWASTIHTRPRPSGLFKTIRHWQKMVHALGPNQNLDRLEDDIKTMTSWVKAIDLKFDPPVTLTISQACPNCHKTHHLNNEGEQSPALRIVWKKSFSNSLGECQECGKTWAGETQLRQMRWELDNDDTPTV